MWNDEAPVLARSLKKASVEPRRHPARRFVMRLGSHTFVTITTLALVLAAGCEDSGADACDAHECASDGPQGGAGDGDDGGLAGAGGTGGEAGVEEGGGSESGPSTCPYRPDAPSCVAACANLQGIAAACSEAAIDPYVSFVLATLAAAPPGACQALCAADAPAHAEQWGCFQAAPSCSAILLCTAAACPN
jgi:hypothetical protein